MNLNMGILECEECQDTFSCRIGMSNRHTQEFSITCKNCGSIASIVIAEDKNISRTGVRKVGVRAEEGNSSYHLDLHLDFPVFESESWHPFSPFMLSALMGGESAVAQHAYNMSSLNDISSRYNFIKNTLNFYERKKYDLFARNTNEYLKIESVVSTDIGAEMLLFRLLFDLLDPFLSASEVNYDIDNYTKAISNISSSKLTPFLKEVTTNKATDNCIFDAIKIYKSVLEKEVIFRPALFLDLDRNHSKSKLPYRISSEGFESIQDLFKDISEVLSRQLSFVAGINNLIKRGSHDDFLVVKSKKGIVLSPSSLQKFADLDFGKKLEFIDDSWYKISKDVADNQLRNSTAHFKWDYDSVNQKVTYFPKKEGLDRLQSKEISLLDYTNKILASFRLMHRLNYLCHIINLKANNKI
ncbi:hypothetical protein O1C65_003513 [Vibrio cholerae]|nr:hypothetical protein [Vibrio cholerae]